MYFETWACCGVPSAAICSLVLVHAASATEAKSPEEPPLDEPPELPPPPQPATRTAPTTARRSRVTTGLDFILTALLSRFGGLFAADDVFDHVGGDVLDFFFGQGAFERRHAAAAVGDLFFGAGLFFGFRHRRQVRTAVAAVAGGAVADRALFGEDFFARFRVRRATRFGRFLAFDRRFFVAFVFFGFTDFFAAFFFFGGFLTGVLGAFSFFFGAFLPGHRPVQGEDPEVFAVGGGGEAVAARVDRDLLFAFVFEDGDRGVGARAGLEAPEFFAALNVVGDQVTVVVADEHESACGGHGPRVARFFIEFVLPLDLPGRHVVRGQEARRVEPGRDHRFRPDRVLPLDEFRFFGRDDQSERSGLRADEVHVLVGVERGGRPVVAPHRRVRREVDRARVGAHRGEDLGPDDFRFRRFSGHRFFDRFDRFLGGFDRAERFHRRLGLGRPGFLRRILWDLHLGDRVDRLAGLAVDQVDPTGLRGLAHAFAHFAVHFAVEEHGRRRRVV